MSDSKTSKSKPMQSRNRILSTVFGCFAMYLAANNIFKPVLVTSIWQFYSLQSAYLLLHILLRGIFQYLSKSSQSLQKVCKCLENIVNNSILYLIVLTCLLNPTHQGSVYSEQQVIKILELFIWGRILFSIGYFLGTCIGIESLRTYGFRLNIASLLSLFTALLDFNLFSIFG